MKGNYYQQYKDYVVNSQRKKLVLFGAGRRAFEIIYDYYLKEDIAFICDNDKSKQNKKIYNIPICSPEILRESPEDYVVIITVRDGFIVKRIEQQLMEMKVPYFYHAGILDYTNLDIERYDVAGRKKFHEFNTYQLVQDNMDKIKEVRGLLCDSKSIDVYDAYIEKVMYNVKNYEDIADDIYEHYFSDGIFKYSDKEYLVDGGAYDGGDAIWFAEMLRQEGKTLEKAYCFEPDSYNFQNTSVQLRNYFKSEMTYHAEEGVMQGNHFKVYQAGLYDKSTMMGFRAYGTFSSRFSETEVSIGNMRTVSLDSVIGEEKVSFIKYDLEGTDIPAILGAAEIIKRDKPKLALSIYHNVEDLWEIPLLVKKLVPEYKLFVRHHTRFLWDKILYAAIESDLK